MGLFPKDRNLATAPDRVELAVRASDWQARPEELEVRLDAFLRRFLSWRSRNSIQALIHEGLVSVRPVAPERPDDPPALAVELRPSRRLHHGALVVVRIPEEHRLPEVLAEPGELRVLHEDEDVLVVDKPAGLVVHPGAGHDRGTLVQGALAHAPGLAGVGDPARPGVVHRLDHGTSGLLVLAKRDDAYDSLVAQFGARTVERRYRALVWGHPDDDVGLVDAPIGRSIRRPTRMTVSASGREARTRYEVQQRFTAPVEVALLACRLETGRTHQIRVHLSAIGHPVVGDDQYGGERGVLSPGRPLLHAETLGFVHPGTGRPVSFRSALPADFRDVLERLG
ncbi:MAG: RluA family pseudouridine synthase [Acidimicrobiales bacterium]|nr:RluA family pseudouridine synthase [Acidimicrobiales bacterium]